MATILYRNAKMFIADTQIDTQLSELSVDYKVEILDVTTFGADTRIKRGGLYVAAINGKGFFDVSGGVGAIDSLLWTLTGADASTLSNGFPVVMTAFANGINEGTLTDMGFAMKGLLTGLTLGGGVGSVLPISFTSESQGVY